MTLLRVSELSDLRLAMLAHACDALLKELGHTEYDYVIARGLLTLACEETGRRAQLN